MHPAVFFPIILLIYLIKRYRSRRHLPPGPKGYPIIGNIYDIPQVNEWIAYKHMSEACKSDVIHLDLFGTDMIILNSRESCKELLEVRSAIYSDRPDFAMLNLVGFGWNLGFMRFADPRWRDARALFHKEISPISEHYPTVLDASRTLLYRLATNPDQFIQHLRHMAGTIILSIAYGIDVQPSRDPYVEMAERSLHAMAVTGNPGHFLVDSFPILKHIPSWFPGAGFKRLAKQFRSHVVPMPTLTLDFVKRSMADGTAKTSMASRNISEMQEKGAWTPYQESVLSSALGTMYSAGADTTVSSLGTFILAMAKYPEIQKKAQAVVDEAFGGDCLPDFSILPSSIPYIQAILYEVLRWKPVTPLAVGHSVIQDDVYKGYHIPRGAVVYGNAWALLHDQTMYGPDTDEFNPERFLKNGDINPQVESPDYAFGFGRRVCLGQAMAEASIWISILSILACFDILPPVDEKGRKIVPAGTYSSGFICYPDPFQCLFVPRSSQTQDLIGSLQE